MSASEAVSAPGEAMFSFGERIISDPYRHLENEQAPETLQWVHEQQLRSEAYVAGMKRGKEVERAVQRELARPRFGSAPASGGDWVFLVVKEAPDAASVLERIRQDADGTMRRERIPIPEGCNPHPGHIFPSPTGRLVAFGASSGGSEAMSIVVIDVERQVLVGQPIAPLMLPFVSWRADEAGFYYSVLRGVHWMTGSSAPEACLRYHALGISTSDPVVFAHAWDNGETVLPWALADGRRVAIVKFNLFRRDSELLLLDTESGETVSLMERAPGLLRPFGEHGEELFLISHHDAARGKVVATMLASTNYGHVRIVIGEQPGELKSGTAATGTGALLQGDCIIVVEQWSAQDRLIRFDVSGNRLGAIDTGECIDILGIATWRGANDILIIAQSHAHPPQIYKCSAGADLASKLPLLIDEADLDVVVRQDSYRSDDETLVPMTIVHGRNTEFGSAPTLITVYGGISLSVGPLYSTWAAAWLALGGILVVAHVRGGGELGAAWHEAGSGARKRATFNDFKAGCEYLQSLGVRAEQLVAKGQSLGGLAIGVAYNEFPELFAGLIAQRPLLDLFAVLASAHGGHMRAELGDPSQDSATFDRLVDYAPIQNLSPAPYKPALLVICAAEDERALPGWTYKYVAAAKAVATPEQHVLLHRQEGAGHVNMGSQAVKDLAELELKFALVATGFDERGGNSV